MQPRPRFRSNCRECEVGDYVTHKDGDPESQVMLFPPPPKPLCDVRAVATVPSPADRGVVPWRFERAWLKLNGQRVRLWRRVA
jgi:hypothetical protein